MKNPNKSHPGKAGRKASPFPLFNKEFRATPEEQVEFLKLLPGDARDDFVRLFNLLLEVKEQEQDKQFFETGESIMEGLTEGRIVHYVMPDGEEHRPAIVVKVWRKTDGTPPDNGVSNLQVFTDGTNDYYHTKDSNGEKWIADDDVKTGIVWRTSIVFSAEPKPNTWHWIEKA